MKDLGLSGKSLQSVLVEYIVSMKLSESHFIAIESPFRLDVDGGRFTLSPEEKPDEVLEALNRLVGDTIEEATATAAGRLSVVFRGGARVTVEPDEAYEAWNVSGPNGALIVCTPGGDLVVWSGD